MSMVMANLPPLEMESRGGRDTMEQNRKGHVEEIDYEHVDRSESMIAQTSND